jgi:DnaJ-class molecular chaperone
MTNARPDLYAVLGVAPTASQAEISHAYRTMVRRHHPDTCAPDDESENATSDTTLQQVIAAYTVLHDPTRRADYDRQARPGRRPPQQAVNPYAPHHRPPIIAGPVCRHQAPDPPSP